jgi:hypothetical protein
LLVNRLIFVDNQCWAFAVVVVLLLKYLRTTLNLLLARFESTVMNIKPSPTFYKCLKLRRNNGQQLEFSIPGKKPILE